MPLRLRRLREAKSFYSQVDEVVTASGFIPAPFRPNGWVRDAMIVPHSVDYRNVKLPEKRLKSETVTFGFIGSIVPQKGDHVLLRATQMVSEQNVRVEIYGARPPSETDYSTALQELVRGDKRIKFVGAFNQDDLSRSIVQPPRVEEEALAYETICRRLIKTGSRNKKPLSLMGA